MSHKLVSLYIGDGEYYTRIDADKVIADLEESHKKEVGQLLIEIAELKEQLKNSRNARQYWRKEYLIEYKECCSQKHKRCLAMVEKCHALYDKYSMLAADDANWEEEDYYFARWRFFEKWKYKWLELAKQFEEVAG